MAKSKTHSNDGNSKITSTKKGSSKMSKKKKARPSKTGKKSSGESNGDVEFSHSKAPMQRIQVKQRPAVDTASSTIAVRDEVSAVPLARDTQVLASGNFYGTMLETQRVEKLCRSLGLQKRHVAALHRAFKREEQLGTGEITTGEFFTLLNEKPRQLTNGLFERVGLRRGIKSLHFDDFVLCIATLATWTKEEFLRYAFKQFDVDESGVMDGRELRAFCEGLKTDSSFYFSKNVSTAREKLASRDRQQQHPESSGQIRSVDDVEDTALVDLEALTKGSEEFQVAFYPLMQLQQNARACALGDRFWADTMLRRQHVDGAVRYMQLHKGILPTFSLTKRIIAKLIPFSQAHAESLVRELAALKFAEEERILQEQAQARAEAKALALAMAEAQEDT